MEMMKPLVIKGALLAFLFFLVCGCNSGSGMAVPDSPGGNGIPGDGMPGNGMSSDVTWGPRLPGSDLLSPIQEAEDDFNLDNIMDALVRAARAEPFGSSQSSLVDMNGRTADEVTARIIRDDEGNIVYEVTVVTDKSQMAVPVPGPKQSQELRLALFTDLIPGIEPDLTSYRHDVLGVWAWDGEVGAFWDRSPSGPVEFDSLSPIGTATYDGDAVGLHAADGTTTKFLADVEMVADFDTNTVSGKVDRFRSLTGELFGDLPVIRLGKTDFSPQGDAFSGKTTATTVPGSGEWGARWSDGKGREMGGTFGFAEADGSFALLGAFDACSCESATDGNPDDPVASP